LESCDTVQEFTEKSLLKQRFQEKKDIFKKWRSFLIIL
jgi:hypothetical protein